MLAAICEGVQPAGTVFPYARTVILTLVVPALLLAQTAQQSFEQAVAALQQQDYVAAETHLRAVLKHEPNNMGALGNLGVVLTRQRRYVEAVEAYEKALLRSPRDANLQVNLGIAQMKQERCDLAIEPLTHAMQKLPQNPMLRELVATCQLKQGAPDLALRTLDPVPRTAGVLFLIGAAHSRMKRTEQANAAFDQLAKIAPEQSKVMIGRAQYLAGNFNDAITMLEPTEAWLDLAKAYISARRNQEAEKALVKALTADAENSDAHYYMGALLVHLQRYDEAAPHLDATTKADPDWWGGHYYQGRALVEQKRHADAIAKLQKAEQLNPNVPGIYYLLHRAFLALDKKKEALRALSNVKNYRGELQQREIDVLLMPR